MSAKLNKETFLQAWKKRGIRFSVISVVILAVILSFAPVVIKMVIQDWYEDQGVDSVQIEDVDFNFFTGHLAIEGMEVKRNSEVVLSMTLAAVNVSWVDFLFKQIHLQEIDLKDFLLRVNRPEENPMNVAGIVLGAGGTPEEKEEQVKEETVWEFGVSLTRIENFVLHYRDNKIDSEFAVRKADLNNALTWTPDNKAELALSGEINDSPVSIDAEIIPFATNPSFKGKIKLEGLELQEFAELAKPSVNSLSGELYVDTVLDLIMDNNQQVLMIKADGEYALESITAEMEKHTIQFEEYKLQGNTGVTHSLLESTENKTDIKFKGKSQASSVSVIDNTSSLALASIGNTEIDGVLVDGLENITIDQLSLGAIALLKDLKQAEDEKSKSQIAGIKSINVEKIQLLSFNKLEIATVNIEELGARISKDEQGKISLLSRLGDKEEKQEPANEKNQKEDEQEAGDNAEGEAENFQFKVGTVKMTGKSSVVFTDASVIPKFESNVAITQFQITEIDNSKKQGESQFLLKAKLEKHSDLDINGKLKLFSGKNDFNVVAKLKNYELPHLSSYTSKVLGYDLASGQGNLDVNAKKVKDKIDGEARLKFNNLTVKETNPEYMKKLNEQLSIPLDLALSLLRDSNDDIKLKIPVTGELFKPDVGLGDIINTALGNAMKGATMAYLKLAFQPFGALISIAQMAGDAASSINLDPVIFSAGETVLKAENDEYLQKIADLVKGKKGVRIKLCGVSAAVDRNVLLQQKIEAASKKKTSAESAKKPEPPEVSNDELFGLAKGRAEAIKDKLVTQYKIDPARLFVCHPAIKKDADAKPSVELRI